MVPIPTEMGYQKSGAFMTNGNSPTARAGGMCTWNARRMTIETVKVATTLRAPPPRYLQASKPVDAVRKHTTGKSAGRFIHLGTSGCPKISYAITTNGGNKMKRSPVHWPAKARQATKRSI